VIDRDIVFAIIFSLIRSDFENSTWEKVFGGVPLTMVRTPDPSYVIYRLTIRYAVLIYKTRDDSFEIDGEIDGDVLDADLTMLRLAGVF
jgi:hypothetical protein